MDLKFLVNEEKSESFLTFVPKFSFVNKYTDIDDFNKYEKIEDLFKIDNNQISFEYTFSNLKELKQNVHPNPINEDENKFDKKFAENIQWKEREKILSKRPFKEKKDLGRKKKEYEGLGLHNKFSDDNIIRKVKNTILKCIMEFINQKIKTVYGYKYEKDAKEKKLYKLKQNQSISSRIDYNKNFLHKTLDEIFSADISSKYSIHLMTHNKNLIESLINDEDEQKRNVFIKIFNLTFLDCLNQFRGSQKFEELEGVNELEDYLKDSKIEVNKEYCALFKFFVNNFEKIIMDKKPKVKNKK